MARDGICSCFGTERDIAGPTADFDGADFDGADFDGADFDGVTGRGAVWEPRTSGTTGAMATGGVGGLSSTEGLMVS
ncbi:pentapeptide repeat-containing protein [Streptomyces sp. NPDC018000]|uniref:pentapeptide repeat-containing protein n=1 Tax=Streptomyces sp. NPDC018000 TaxID=3365028 RepID=UPI00378F683D